MKLSRLIPKLQLATPTQTMPGFDKIYYSYWYRDTVHFDAPLLQHYLQYGWKEGRDPSAGFSTDGYLTANPDVKASGLNPLTHFLNYGLAEGRRGWEKDPHVPPPTPRSPFEDEPQKLLMPPRMK